MKKIFEKPELKIAEFRSENVVTTSGINTTVEDDLNNGMLTLGGESDINTNLFSFVW